jgi:predicted nucleic acid-binding Zn ribbon protein
MKKCKECNKLFDPNGTSKVYCSDNCAKTYYNRKKLKKYYDTKTPIIKKCKTCSKNFEVWGNQQYCSDYCKDGVDGKFYVYILPEINYAGMTKNIKQRMSGHRKQKGITEYKILASYDCPKKAHLHETQLHVDGYDGFYVEKSYC